MVTTPKETSYNKNEVSYYKLLQTDPLVEPQKLEQSFVIKKFDGDLECVSTYDIEFKKSSTGGYHDCNCPAVKFDCRHKALMKDIVELRGVNSEKFFNFKKRTFHNATEL
jgi:hypothetical protein